MGKSRLPAKKFYNINYWSKMSSGNMHIVESTISVGTKFHWTGHFMNYSMLAIQSVWPVKSCPKMISARKMKDFDIFTKIALNSGRFGQNNCCQRLGKVAQGVINQHIWTHCVQCIYQKYLDSILS